MMAMLATSDPSGRPTAAFGVLMAPGWTVREITFPANKAEQSAAESVERRAGTKGNANQQSTCRTQSRISVSEALERIRQAFAVNGKITGGLA